MLTTDSECEQIQCSGTPQEQGLELIGPEEIRLAEQMQLDIEPVNLYAFLPGLFYCSNQHISVDAILIEVTQNEMLGMTLTSFRPEDVRTFDVTKGLIADAMGKMISVPVSLSTLGRFDAAAAYERTSEGRGKVPKQAQQGISAYPPEIDAALRLAKMVALKELKQAYLTGTVLARRLKTLLEDIEQKGLMPRCRIYVRNRKYPSGKVIESKYRTLDSILQLNSGSGLDCPEDVDVSLELSKLSFSRLGVVNKEVGIEEAIVESYQFMAKELGDVSSKERVIELVFSGASH